MVVIWKCLFVSGVRYFFCCCFDVWFNSILMKFEGVNVVIVSDMFFLFKFLVFNILEIGECIIFVFFSVFGIGIRFKFSLVMWLKNFVGGWFVLFEVWVKDWILVWVNCCKDFCVMCCFVVNVILKYLLNDVFWFVDICYCFFFI